MPPERSFRRLFRTAACTAVALLAPFAGRAEDLRSALATLREVGPLGQGNAAATAAWATAAAAPADQIPVLLEAFQGASERSRNYLVAAVTTVADRTLRAERPLPMAALGAFLLNPAQDPRARRLAFDLIRRADADTADALLAGLLDDPGAELRREAVQRLIERAQATLAAGRKDAAAVLFQQALGFAREADQIGAIGAPLKELGHPVDLVQQLGFLTEWKVVGPFTNQGGTGFARVFPPEEGVNLEATYDGLEGKVAWKSFTTTHELGMMDLNKAFAPLKEVTGYAFTTFHADAAQPAQLRLGCKNGWKIWFNGDYLFGRDEYHRGAEIDQYRLPVTLKAGRNTILVKLTQNEQKEEWTVEWEFQLRLTDPAGKVIRPVPAREGLASLP